MLATGVAIRTQDRVGWGVDAGRGRTADQATKRQVPRDKGRKIRDYLRATDESVEIVDERPGTLAPPPPPVGDPDYAKEPLQMLTERSPIVLMVKVVSQRGELTHAEDAIQTVLQCEIVEVIKSPQSGAYLPGEVVPIVSLGGEMSFGRQTVRAHLRGMTPWRDQEQYVVFVDEIADGRLSAATGQWLWIDGPLLRPTIRNSVLGHDQFEKDATINSLRAYALASRGQR